MTTINIKLNNSEKQRLSAIAMRYGLTLPDLAKKVLEELKGQFELESIHEYENPSKVAKAVKIALQDYKKGKFFQKKATNGFVAHMS